MVTISHVVNKMVDERIYLYESLSKGIASYGSVAKHLKPEIEKELNREVDHFAIVTALRRYAEKLVTKFNDIKFDTKYSEVNLPKRKGWWKRYLERLNKSTGGKPPDCCH